MTKADDAVNPITKWDETVKRVVDKADVFAVDIRKELDAIRVAGEQELDDLYSHNKMVAEENEKLRDQVKAQAAEIERLRLERDTALSRADVAEAQVKAWNDAVYVEGLPMRFVPETDFGAEVPPIPSVTTKRVTELLGENKRLRGALEGLPDVVEISRLINANLGKPNTSVARALAERLAYAEQALKGEA